jgi:hypothetical protein
MADEPALILVWLRGRRGPEMQLWLPDVYAGELETRRIDPTRPEILSHHNLNDDEAKLEFTKLAKLYPPPEGAQDVETST